MELSCPRCGRAVVVAEPFSTLQLNATAVVVDDVTVHECHRVLLDRVARVRRESAELRERALETRVRVEARGTAWWSTRVERAARQSG